jgi:tetratricopeptide (TPR) repeat protein
MGKYVFGELLRGFLAREGMTNKQLAGLLCVHQRTVDGWTSSMHLPKNATAVRRIAAALNISPFERDLLLVEAGRTPGLCNVPIRNRNFTGRDDILGDLAEGLLPSGTAVVIQALSGMGGVGKTQLVTEYIYRSRGTYDLVWWLHAEQPETLKIEYSKLARELDLPECRDPARDRVVEAVRGWLEKNQRWLLVFDNACEPAELVDSLPTKGGGHILITSRNPNWEAIAETLVTDVFQREEALAFLLKRAKRTEPAAAAELASELGYLPLALEQAAAYILETQTTIANYLELYRHYSRELLHHGAKYATYPMAVAATFQVSFNKVGAEQPAALELLMLCGWLAPDDIPIEFLTAGAQNLPMPLAATTANRLLLDQAVATLCRYSLARRQGNSLSIHRLVQAVARGQLDFPGQRTWIKASLMMLIDVYPLPEHQNQSWRERFRLLPHALAIAGHVEPLLEGLAASEFVGLAYDLGRLFRDAAQLAWAQIWVERALEMNRYLNGNLDHSVAAALNELGLIANEMRNLPVAEQYFEDSLRLYEELDGVDSPSAGIVVNNLGMVNAASGNLVTALAYYERALAIAQSVYGSTHPDVSRTLYNLGSVLRSMGKLKEARHAYEQALAIDEALFGPDHPSTGAVVGGLAGVLDSLGESAAALGRYAQALAIAEKTYGPMHPSVASILSNLGELHQHLVDLPAARDCFERALAIDEKAYGPDHPSVAADASALGLVLQDQGDGAGAKAYLARALEIDRRVYGPDHRAVGRDHLFLSQVLLELDELDAAKDHVEQALCIDQKVFSAESGALADDWNTLGRVLNKQGLLSEARMYFERALTADEITFGANHLAVARDSYNLYDVARKQGNVDEARIHLTRACSIFEEKLGSGHVYAMSTRAELEAL